MKGRCQGYRRSIKGKCRVAAWAGTSAIHREEPLMRHTENPAAMASDGPAADPAAPETAGPDGYGLHPLDAADAAFRALTTGPRPLALNPARLAPGLPDQPVPLGELKALLLHPATPATARNKVWAELVRRARTGAPAGVVGLTGVALPGLRRAVAAPSAAYRGEVEDLQTEVLTGFLAAMRGLDPDDLDRAPLSSRLCWAAWRAGQALAPCRHGSSPAGLLT